MIKPKILAQILCLTLTATAFQHTHADNVSWMWCGTDEWDSGECWEGFSSPDSDDTALIYPGTFFNDANVQIVPGDSKVANTVAIYTEVADDTSRVTQSGGSLTIGTKFSDDSWAGGNLLIGVQEESSGTSAYYLSDGALSTRAVWIRSEGSFNSAFFQTGGLNLMETLEVGAAKNALPGQSFYRLDGGTLQADIENIGTQSTASFSHFNGSNILSQQLILGRKATGVGFYNLFNGLLVSPEVFIGNEGSGQFTQSNGNHVPSSEIFLGHRASGIGQYSLVGGDLIVPSLTIGNEGSGLFWQTGGKNVVTDVINLGLNSAGEGTYTLSGGTLQVNRIIGGATAESLSTFNLDGGTLELTGPEIDVKLFNVSDAEGSSGTLKLGDGKTLTADSLFLGRGSAGAINQTGGTIEIRDDLIMGYFSENESDNAIYLLLGGNVSATNMTVNRCFSAAAFSQIGGTTSISQTMTLAEHCGTATYLLAGGTLTVLDIVNGSGTGNVLLTGGTLSAGSIYAEDMASFDFSGGTLSVDQFFGTLSNNGGNLSPDIYASLQTIGNTHITGDYSQSAQGRITIELGPNASQFDSVSVDGAANIAGELQVLLLDGFNPIEGDNFDVLTAETITGGFSVLNLPALSNGLEWSLNILADESGTNDVLRLSVESTSEVMFMDGFE